MKTTFNLKAIVKIAALASASVALSGCVYDLGLGYASDGYYDDAYGCDPYSDYDLYYDCDIGYGFNNIGYGGGWYDNYYYPGYGFFLFDNIGRRYPMRDQHRRYWGEKRHSWYRENRGRNGDSGRYQRRSRGYTEGATSGAIGRPEWRGGRARDAEDLQRVRDGRREGRRGGREQWRGRESRGADAVPVPNANTPERRGTGQIDLDGHRKSSRRNDNVLNEDGAISPRPIHSPVKQNVTGSRQQSDYRSQSQKPRVSRHSLPEGGIKRPE